MGGDASRLKCSIIYLRYTFIYSGILLPEALLLEFAVVRQRRTIGHEIKLANLPLSAMLLDSVAPEVKMISLGSAPIREATCKVEGRKGEMMLAPFEAASSGDERGSGYEVITSHLRHTHHHSSAQPHFKQQLKGVVT